MKKITDKEKQEIIDLFFNTGLNVLQISKRVNVSRTTISQIINKYKEENNIDFTVGTITKLKTNSSYKYIIHIPKKFLDEIGMKDKDKKVRILVNKKEGSIILNKQKDNNN